MEEMKYVYGPVPSRRLGISLGISSIPKKTCNYSCVYCQLGRTNHLTNERKMFFSVEDIIIEFENILKQKVYFDVITIVGEGEPTLYLGLGELIDELKKRVKKPVAVITNGALLYDPQVRLELSKADIVLPTMNAYDEELFKKINRPHRNIKFDDVMNGLKIFSKDYKGQLWIEIMFVKGMNDSIESLKKYAVVLKNIEYDKLYLNTVVRAPAETNINSIDHDRMNDAVKILGGISIELLTSIGFHSEIKDDYAAITSIIKRHPMNQYEIKTFLNSRNCDSKDIIFKKLEKDSKVILINYNGYKIYRLK